MAQWIARRTSNWSQRWYSEAVGSSPTGVDSLFILFFSLHWIYTERLLFKRKTVVSSHRRKPQKLSSCHSVCLGGATDSVSDRISIYRVNPTTASSSLTGVAFLLPSWLFTSQEANCAPHHSQLTGIQYRKFWNFALPHKTNKTNVTVLCSFGLSRAAFWEKICWTYISNWTRTCSFHLKDHLQF